MEKITFAEVLWVIAAITAMISFVTLINKPHKTLEDKITKQENQIKELCVDINNQQKLLNSSLKVQLLLMQHMIYGNHTDAIKKKLEELEAAIVDVRN